MLIKFHIIPQYRHFHILIGITCWRQSNTEVYTHTVHSFYQTEIPQKLFHSFFVFTELLPQHLLKQKQHDFTMTKMNNPTMASRKAKTSRQWYWYQLRLCDCTRKCLAPLLRMTNSIQNTASSSGLMGWSC